MGAVRITSLNPKFNGSHFGLPPSGIHRMNGWVANSRILWRMRTAPIMRFKKPRRFKKRDFWTAVQQAGCFISMCVTPVAFSTTCPLVSGSKKSATYFKEISTGLSISCGQLFEPDTKEHVVEKATGVTHIKMRHPACFTTAQKSFFFSWICKIFCILLIIIITMCFSHLR